MIYPRRNSGPLEAAAAPWTRPKHVDSTFRTNVQYYRRRDRLPFQSRYNLVRSSLRPFQRGPPQHTATEGNRGIPLWSELWKVGLALHRPPIPIERPGGCRWLTLEMNVPGGTPEAPARTGKLAVVGAAVGKYDTALQRLHRKLQVAISFQSTPQRLDVIRYAMDAVCQGWNTGTPNILSGSEDCRRPQTGNLARLRSILPPPFRNIAPARPWKVEALLCDRPASAKASAPST